MIYTVLHFIRVYFLFIFYFTCMVHSVFFGMVVVKEEYIYIY